MEDGEGEFLPLLLGELMLFHEIVDERTLVFVEPLSEFCFRCIKLSVYPGEIGSNRVFSIVHTGIHGTMRSCDPSSQIVVQMIPEPLMDDAGDFRRVLVVRHSLDGSCKHNVKLVRQPLGSQETPGAERQRHLAG